MLLVLTSILLHLQSVWCGGGAVAPLVALEGSENTNNKIIDILKENLQKDNDDYKDMTSNNPSANTEPFRTTSGVPATKPPNNSYRRALRDEVKLPAPAAGDQPGDQKQDPNRYPKYVNKEKVEKIAKFIEKYQGLVTKIMSESTVAGPTGALSKGVVRAGGGGVGAPGKQGGRPVQSGAVVRAGGGGTGGPAGASAGQGGPARGAQPPFDPNDPAQRPPSNTELDMSPAIGGLIHGLRMQNRLCQRSVMNPEGPKYDSKGREYLHEFTTEHGQEFAVTRSKQMVLPKCCNCCSKSVLGCE